MPDNQVITAFHVSRFTHHVSRNKKSPLDLAVKRGPNGGWEFAKLSFPRWHLALCQGKAASFPTPFSTASGVRGLIAGPSSVFQR